RHCEKLSQLGRQPDVASRRTLGVAYGGLDGDHYFTATSDVWKHPILSRYVPRPLLEAHGAPRDGTRRGSERRERGARRERAAAGRREGEHRRARTARGARGA